MGGCGPLLWFPREAGEAGRAGVGLAHLDTFSGLETRGLSLCVWDLACVIRAADSGPESESESGKRRGGAWALNWWLA